MNDYLNETDVTGRAPMAGTRQDDDAADVALAAQIAYLALQRRLYRGDWRELWSAVWLRVRRERRRGESPTNVRRAARFAVIDYLRDVRYDGLPRGARDRGALPVVSLDTSLVVDGEVTTHGALVPDRDQPPPVEHRLLAMWCDARGQRRGIPMRLRLVGYLYLVEGWVLREVADVLGVSKSQASGLYRQFREGVRP